MAHAVKAARLETAKRVVGLEGNPERRTLVLVATALAILALAVVAFSLLPVAQTGCSGIVLSMQRYQCYDSLAQSTSNISYCTRSGTYEQGCAISLANAKANATYCKVLSGQVYVGCIENVSLRATDPSYCSMLSGANVSLCYYHYENGINFSTESYCGSMTNSTYKAYCNYSFDYMHAISTGQNVYCSMLPQSENTSLVYVLSNLGNASVRQDYGFYSYLNTTPAQYCYNVETAITLAKGASNSTNSANVTSNISISSINNTEISNACGTGNYIVLHNATASAFSSICGYAFYTARAISEQNASECSMISSQNLRYSCIENLATSTQNALVCATIGTQSQMAACEYAVSLNESSGTG